MCKRKYTEIVFYFISRAFLLSLSSEVVRVQDLKKLCMEDLVLVGGTGEKERGITSFVSVLIVVFLFTTILRDVDCIAVPLNATLVRGDGCRCCSSVTLMTWLSS